MRHNITNPEAMLSNLNRALRDLLGAVTWLGDELRAKQLQTEAGSPALVVSNLRNTFKKLWIAELLSQNWVIAIAGSQGAGKTTLACMMYGREDGTSELDEWLPKNIGRGETAPVLLLETEGLTTPQGYVKRFATAAKGRNDRPESVIHDVPVTPAEFLAALKGGDVECILPVLRVPRRYFHGENQGFLLLPGYEIVNGNNRDWQTSMRAALAACSACIVVTDPTRMADSHQQKLLADMRSGEMAGAYPIVVISKSGDAVADGSKRLELVRSAGEIFKLPENDRDALIICSDTSPAHDSVWRPKLEQAISDAAASSVHARERQANDLAAILQDELSSALYDIRECLVEKAADHENEQHENIDLHLKRFDSSVKKLRAAYKKEAGRIVNTHFASATGTLEKKLSADFEGLGNKITRLLEKHSEKRGRVREAVQQAWKGAGDQDANWLAVLDQLVKSRFSGSSRLVSDQNPVTEGSHLSWLGNHKPEPDSVVWTADFQRTLSDVAALANSNGGSGAFSKDIERSYEDLPYVVLEFVRLLRSVKVDPAPAGVVLPASDVLGATSRVHKGLLEGMTAAQATARGLAALMALDAADGTINSIGALASALGMGTTAAGFLTVGVVGGILATLVMVEIDRYDAQLADSCHAALLRIRDYQETQLLDVFDTFIGEFRDHLYRALARRYRLGEHLMRRDRIERALAEVQSVKADIESLIVSRTPVLALAP